MLVDFNEKRVMANDSMLHAALARGALLHRVGSRANGTFLRVSPFHGFIFGKMNLNSPCLIESTNFIKLKHLLEVSSSNPSRGEPIVGHLPDWQYRLLELKKEFLAMIRRNGLQTEITKSIKA